MMGMFVFGEYCTYRCPYCFDFAKHGVRTRMDGWGACASADVLDAVVRLVNDWPEEFISFSFSGGEPTVAPGVLEAMAQLRNTRAVKVYTNGADLRRLAQWVAGMPKHMHIRVFVALHAWRFTLSGRVDRRLLADTFAGLRVLADLGAEVAPFLLISRDQLVDPLYMSFAEAVCTHVEFDHDRLDVRPIKTMDGHYLSTATALVYTLRELSRCSRTPTTTFLHEGLRENGSEHADLSFVRQHTACPLAGHQVFIDVATVYGCLELSAPVDVHDPEGVQRMLLRERTHAVHACSAMDRCNVYQCGLIEDVQDD